MIRLRIEVFKKISMIVIVLFLVASMGMTTISHICYIETVCNNTSHCCENIHNDAPSPPHPTDEVGIASITCCFNNRLDSKPLDFFIVERDTKTNRIDDFSLSFFPLLISDTHSANFVSFLNITQRVYNAKPTKLHILNEAFLL